MKLFAALLIFICAVGVSAFYKPAPQTWIRINQLGYLPAGKKVAVWGSKEEGTLQQFQLVDSATGKVVFTGAAGKAFGAYGPFTQTYRLNFSAFGQPGTYAVKANGVQSPYFKIGPDVYNGTADFALRYMRQQRCGFNPFLRDSCHTHDGYTLYGPMPDSTKIDAVGGWHDASDYLQYVTTSANATYHLLMAHRDFAPVFADRHAGNGLEGKNGVADVLDEAKWGLDWLLKMHPNEAHMYNQIADDRDHISMRIPKLDSQYGRGFQRPVYFVTGEPQQRGKFKNNTGGTSSTAAKFASAFALGAQQFAEKDLNYSHTLQDRAFSANNYAYKKLGVTQTASVKAPYIYAEDNWVDDMELAAAALNRFGKSARHKAFADTAYKYAQLEKLTPWLGGDTAHHYQWYPFINVGHYELAKQLTGKRRDTLVGYYQKGIDAVWAKAKGNAFYRGVPFIWCSNNLTTAFATQCYWYRQLTGNRQYEELEQANIDWLFGVNPWGTSMVYGLPATGDTPVDPHSAFTHLGKYGIDGGLVDGPVYGNIYKNLIGIKLYNDDEYAPLQSDLVVYHDDYGDYSTNEPTMDGTASLIYLLAAKEAEAKGVVKKKVAEGFTYFKGAIIRGDTSEKKMALVFTGDEFGEGGMAIANALQQHGVKASFFFTGRFYRNKSFKSLLKHLQQQGHYLGAHSDAHLLYNDWTVRDSLLVTKAEFLQDLQRNYAELKKMGIGKKEALYFLPPYEWYNDTIAAWTREAGLQLINYTPGTLSHADYTTPDAKNYRSSETIYNSIVAFEEKSPHHLNGAILLLHIGTDSQRTDKFYHLLPQLLTYLKTKEYKPVRVDDLLPSGVQH